MHGAGGEWKVARQRLKWDILRAVQEGAAEFGIMPRADFNDGSNEGSGFFEVNQRGGVRWNTAKGFLRPAMNRPNLRVATTFQRRFGKAKGLEPATDAVLEEEARSGAKRIAIAAPGFSADCLDTLEELAIRGREQFLAAGGERFAALAGLNAGDAGMAMLDALVRRELSGWINCP